MVSKSTGAFAPQTGTVHINELPPNAEVVAFGHRSGAETHMACPRRYFLNYEYLGSGITPAPGPLYFAVGTAVHHGLANMLLEQPVEACIEAALASLQGSDAYRALELPDEPALNTAIDSQMEQRVLVEGLLYAFYVYGYPSLREGFDVLAVETGAVEFVPVEGDSSKYVAIQSRPDAILRNKQTHEVCGISWKTIDDPTDLRRSQLVNDLQGFMELHYGERILEKLAQDAETSERFQAIIDGMLGRLRGAPPNVYAENLMEIAEYAAKIRIQDIPTEVDYIQTVFLVKGQRRLLADGDAPVVTSYQGDGSDEYGGYQPGKSYRQMSHLCYRYRNSNVEIGEAEFYKSGPNKGRPKPLNVADPQYFEESWAYRFYKPGNETSSALSQRWLTTPIRPDQVRDWVDRLNRGEVYPSVLGDERNAHPLARVVRFEEPLYRDAMRAQSHVRQQRHRFVQIAQTKQEFNRQVTSVPWGSLEIPLDKHWPQHLISCRTPYRCAYYAFCHGPETTQINFQAVPQGFESRTPHHEFEREYRNGGSSDGCE